MHKLNLGIWFMLQQRPNGSFLSQVPLGKHKNRPVFKVSGADMAEQSISECVFISFELFALITV